MKTLFILMAVANGVLGYLTCQTLINHPTALQPWLANSCFAIGLVAMCLALIFIAIVLKDLRKSSPR